MMQSKAAMARPNPGIQPSLFQNTRKSLLVFTGLMVSAVVFAALEGPFGQGTVRVLAVGCFVGFGLWPVAAWFWGQAQLTTAIVAGVYGLAVLGGAGHYWQVHSRELSDKGAFTQFMVDNAQEAGANELEVKAYRDYADQPQSDRQNVRLLIAQRLVGNGLPIPLKGDTSAERRIAPEMIRLGWTLVNQDLLQRVVDAPPGRKPIPKFVWKNGDRESPARLQIFNDDKFPAESDAFPDEGRPGG